jgi:hypothetical protein
VKLAHKTKVIDVGDFGSLMVLTLSNGDTLTLDVYPPLFGVRVNTYFVQPHLNSAGMSS